MRLIHIYNHHSKSILHRQHESHKIRVECNTQAFKINARERVETSMIRM